MIIFFKYLVKDYTGYFVAGILLHLILALGIYGVWEEFANTKYFSLILIMRLAYSFFILSLCYNLMPTIMMLDRLVEVVRSMEKENASLSDTIYQNNQEIIKLKENIQYLVNRQDIKIH